MKNIYKSAFSQIEMDPPHEILYISPHPFEAGSLFYRVNRAGVVRKTPPTFHIRRNETYCFGVVHCVFGGKGLVRFRGKEYSLRERQVFLLPPYERHEYKSDPDDPLGVTFVEFYGGCTPQLTEYILSSSGPIFEGAAFTSALTLTTSILSRLETGDLLNVNLELYAMLTLLCENMQAGSAHDETNEIVQYIDEHCTQRLTLESLAQHFGYNPAYFSRKFRQLTGIPVSQYILARKVSRACYLLIATSMSLEEIAETLGFYDVSHLISRFRQTEGVTPAQYRRQNHGLAGGAR